MDANQTAHQPDAQPAPSAQAVAGHGVDADDAATAKLYTKAFFARRQQTASFMAQLSEDFPGDPTNGLLDEGEEATS